jgi:O-methyltransferase involved in polyketide biosynthesis
VSSDNWLRQASRPVRPVKIDIDAPNIARVWNYLSGGRDNFEADRRVAKLLISVAPEVAEFGPVTRAFLRRTVTYLAAEAGLRQFLDVGPGLPTGGNTHEAAQAIDPACRVVYVDNDPVVLSHARAALRSAAGGVSFLDADARDPAAVIKGAGQTLDLTEPVAIMMTYILNFISDADADAMLASLVGAVPSGSYLVVMQPTPDGLLAVAGERWNNISPVPVILRDRATVERWFTDLGLNLVEPGLVRLNQWRPEPDDPDCSETLPLLGAVAVKP